MCIMDGELIHLKQFDISMPDEAIGLLHKIFQRDPRKRLTLASGYDASVSAIFICLFSFPMVILSF